MSNRSHYSAAEWRLLADAPLAAAAAVALADEGGGEREAAAIITGWRAAGLAFAASELIRDLVATMDPQDRTAHEPPPAKHPANPDSIRDEAVELCIAAADLLAQRTTPAELQAYKAFIMQIAAHVAEAASESGPFNFTNRVSRSERSALRELAAALRWRE
jgi:hypothetical protein